MNKFDFFLVLFRKINVSNSLLNLQFLKYGFGLFNRDDSLYNPYIMLFWLQVHDCLLTEHSVTRWVSAFQLITKQLGATSWSGNNQRVVPSIVLTLALENEFLEIILNLEGGKIFLSTIFGT